MVSTFFETIEEEPATFILIIGMSLLYCYQWNYDTPYEKIGIQYDRILTDHQFYRLPLSALSHGSILHIAFNMWSLWNVGSIEYLLSTLTYCEYTLILLFGSEILMLIGTWILFRFFHREGQRQTYTVGYSAVVFGWMAVYAIKVPKSMSLFGLSIPGWLYPFVALILVSIFVPNASFIGHLCGILIGFAIAFGLFEWVDDYLYLCALIWILIGVIVSVKLTTDVPLPFIRLYDPNDEERPMSIVNGSIVYHDDVSVDESRSIGGGRGHQAPGGEESI